MSTARIVRVVIGTVSFTVPVTLTVLDVFGYVAKVEGVSMQPSLNPESSKSDYVFLNKWAARHQPFRHGEVVSLISPTNANQRLIKRIIAMEGDIVKTLHYKNRYVKIPEGHCWVEGDHHGHSLDSNLFGPVSVSLIQAKASRIVWPPVRWQPLKIDETFLKQRVNPLFESSPSDRLLVLAKDCSNRNDVHDQKTNVSSTRNTVERVAVNDDGDDVRITRHVVVSNVPKNDVSDRVADVKECQTRNESTNEQDCSGRKSKEMSNHIQV